MDQAVVILLDDIYNLATIENADLTGPLSLQGKLLYQRPGFGSHISLAGGLRTEFQQLGAETVAQAVPDAPYMAEVLQSLDTSSRRSVDIRETDTLWSSGAG